MHLVDFFELEVGSMVNVDYFQVLCKGWMRSAGWLHEKLLTRSFHETTSLFPAADQIPFRTTIRSR